MTHPSKPSERRCGASDGPIDLNLLPFMNLMTLLIPFLLASIQFMTLAVVDVSMPSIGPARPSTPEEVPLEPPLELTIAITETEYVVAGKAERLAVPVSIPVDELAGLTELMGQLRDERPADCDARAAGSGRTPPESCNVILAPEPGVPYEVIIGVMDATRETEARSLFPYVVVAGGVAH